MRFGRLKVIKREPSPSRVRWRCRCACGRRCVVLALSLRKGTTSSCGCLQVESARRANTTHGMSQTGEHRIWAAMKSRCTNRRLRQWKNYGGRGIRVCQEWMDSFEAFLLYVGPRPSALHTIDRIDNDCGYEPGNVRWSTRTEQQRNKTNSHLITFRGETMCLSEWSKRLGMGGTLRQRLFRGWTVEAAFTIPLGGRR